ncbi:hypothetical protein EJ05DRAFT_503106 [Pseudovirgaria hyperparasitica]|uniref:FAD-binding FR-type domain-containing protein n=1 Tax=Pseudovirgaria hyperparasitica TaxID=470096 RepID=A0A6A6W238_9PEZI|nr:uncharacterized protein EJ05DRAFT_503106 [Pseudovirgaria hyperparasitica]KAF2755647.1 hypothetical protein EJ05DRAFT_503106 [Pseudovirgaria hyperparasitica]
MRIRPRYLVAIGTSIAGISGYQLYCKDNHASLNPATFTPFSIESRERVSTASKVFTIGQDALSNTNVLSDIWGRAIWSIEVKQPQLQIARSYTPLPPSDDVSNPEKQIRLLIKQEKGGEMSTYLHKLPECATIEIRGPHVECVIPENTKEVIFLAGGTGIAPALQVARVLRQRPGSHVCILWANRTMEECAGASIEDESKSSSWTNWLGLNSTVRTFEASTPITRQGPIVKLLEGFRSEMPQSEASTCTIKYYVDEKQKFIKPADIVQQLQDSQSIGVNTGAKIIFVSGPDGFVNYWAGNKLWIDGQETQGPLGGVLSRLDLQGWSVWKL